MTDPRRARRHRLVHRALVVMWVLVSASHRSAGAAPVGDLAAPAAPGQSLSRVTQGTVVGSPQPDGFVPVRFLPAVAGAPSGGDAGAPGTAPPAPVTDPAIAVGPAVGAAAWNWTGARSLKIHLQNAMPWPVTLVLRLRDAAGGEVVASVGLPPGPPQTLALPLAATRPLSFGLLAAPPMPWIRDGERVFVVTQVDGALDPSRVVSVSLSVPRPDAPQVLRIGKLFTETARDDLREVYTGLVDGFGQATRGDWPGKVRDLEDLRRRALEERSALAARGLLGPARPRDRDAMRDRGPGRGGRDGRTGRELGAGSGLPRFTATGHFRTERVALPDGRYRWWLVTPDGEPFFSLGVNTVRPGGDDSIVEGREFMFVDLPPPSSLPPGVAQARDASAVLPPGSGALRGRGHARGRAIDFYRLNLHRVDGETWETRWRERTLARLAAWGFNTLGNWSDPLLALSGALAWTRPIEIRGTWATLSDGQDWWGGAPDPFDPRFDEAVQRSVAEGTRGLLRDRMLLGYFVDNEIAWGDGGSTDPRRRYALALSALRQDARDGAGAPAHAKRALLRQLQARHGDVATLARTWGREAAGWREWSDLEAPMDPVPVPDAAHPAIAEDYSAFLALHADRWFATVAQALKRFDPNHLFLGVRFGARTPEAVAACARWCDVVSFNLYVPTIDDGFEHASFRWLGKPALLTEFHFGSTDRGPFWSGVQPVRDEAERGRAYARLLASVAANPDFVGAHWFQYLDEPASGRWLDGENGHLGLVGITDLPWPEFVQAVGDANHVALRRLLERR